LQILKENEIERLELFNEAVDELLASGFAKEMAEKRTSFSIKFGDIRPNGMHTVRTHERVGHDPDYLNSAILKVRLFTNDGREKISLRKMHELYQSLPIDMTHTDNITRVRTMVNEYLQQQAWVWSLPTATHFDIYDTIIYGLLIHKNKEKRRIIQEWKKDQFLWDMTLSDFETTIRRLILAMKIIQNNNVAVLEKYGR
jgi:hypothetical protein